MKINTLNKGFTLIELIMVIVILGILSAVAVPKFVDLRTEAYQGTVKGYAGALSSAAGINYAGCSALSNAETANKCVKVAKCSDVTNLINPTLTLATANATAVVDSYNLTVDTAVTTNGSTVTCTLQYGVTSSSTVQATYTAIGAAN
jgi:MSHA pilin protein MshA